MAAGGILAYLAHRRRQVKTIPLGEGWWGAGEKPLSEDNKIYPFQVQTSDEEIQVIFNCYIHHQLSSKSTSNKTAPCLIISNVLLQQDLHERIDKTRYTDPLEDSGFQYGFNSTYLKKVVSYWRHEFDWKKQVAVLNKYPHFITKIEGTHSPMLNQRGFLCSAVI